MSWSPRLAGDTPNLSEKDEARVDKCIAEFNPWGLTIGGLFVGMFVGSLLSRRVPKDLGANSWLRKRATIRSLPIWSLGAVGIVADHYRAKSQCVKFLETGILDARGCPPPLDWTGRPSVARDVYVPGTEVEDDRYGQQARQELEEQLDPVVMFNEGVKPDLTLRRPKRTLPAHMYADARDDAGEDSGEQPQDEE